MYPITFTKKFRNIVVLELPLSENSETLFALAYKDEVLNAFVDSIQEEFAEKKEECWQRKDNILVTERGYFLTFYEDDLSVALFPDAKRTILSNNQL
jgi:hypothetical protein